MGTTCCQANQKIYGESEIIKTEPKSSPSSASILVNQFLSTQPVIKRVLMQIQEFTQYQQQLGKDKVLKSAEPTYEMEGRFIGLNPKLSQVKQFVIMVYNDDEYYEGFWQDGLRNGKGVLANKEGQYYCGQWKHNSPHGYGTYQYVNPSALYKGMWQNGLKHGRGEEINPDGSHFIGNYVKGERNGQGKLFYTPDAFYEGEFLDNKPEGLGIYQSAGQIYEGNWKNGKMHGVGKCEWYDTEQQQHGLIGRYFGEYREGIKQGYGEYTDNKGTSYKGMWLNGELNESAPVDVTNAGR